MVGGLYLHNGFSQRTGSLPQPAGTRHKLQTPLANIQELIRHFNISYTAFINKRYKRDEYPLILTTRKPAVFRHANFRQIKSLRARRPDPILSINPEAAKSLGIDDGDRVYIGNKQGRITHRAQYTESLHPRVVVGDHGWWYPEKRADENLHGFTESCINAITSNSPPLCQ